MKMEIIKQLAERFRAAIESAIACGDISTKTAKTTLQSFPTGCCEIASDLLAQYLLENGVVTQGIHGEYDYDYYENQFPHSWLETEDGYIIDITADQYKTEPLFKQYNLEPCYVGLPNQFYGLFKNDRRNDGNFKGLDYLPSAYYLKLKPLYSIIISHIS